MRADAKKLLWLAFSAALFSCGVQQPDLGRSSASLFTNGDFEAGTAGAVPPAPWVLTTYINNGITVTSPQTRASLNLAAGGKNLTKTIAPTPANAAPEPELGSSNVLRLCRYGAKCAQINFHSSSDFSVGGTDNAKNVNSLTQSMVIGASDVDPVDSKVHIRFVYAPVLEDPTTGHTAAQVPYYFFEVTNVTKGTTLYTDFNLSSSGIPWRRYTHPTYGAMVYLDWTLVDITPGAGVAMGDTVKLEFIAAGCSPGGHFGVLYVDGVSAILPGINVIGTAPAQANPGTDLPYTITYRNGSSAAESGVVINFTTPPNTTYKALTPPAGATCTTPAVGAAGTITCTLAGSLAAGAVGSFEITVGINSAATGQILAADYNISSTQEPGLLNGTKIITKLGCTADADCSGSNWCNIAANQCTPKLANGAAMPTDSGHSTPTINGLCNAGAANLVCVSGVCDADNKCGYQNNTKTCSAANGATVCRSGVCDPDLKCGYALNSGPCSTGNAGTVCRSGVCDPDLKCGYANGDGPCTEATAGTVCRSGVCDPDLKCGFSKDVGPCTAGTAAKVCRSGVCDPDLKCGYENGNGPCSAGNAATVCRSSVCDPDLKCGYANGNGTCSSGTAGVVCRSSVCDPDMKCGYANGTGTCSAGNAGTVCRSGTCSVAMLCQAPGGCTLDGDCLPSEFCMESTGKCTTKLVNGTAMPSDPGHHGATLDATCNGPAGMVVCQSGVCDADNKCGYQNNTKSCTMADAGKVCRSGVCHTDMKCGYANNFGPCDDDNAGIVCRSGVCDPDLKCGYSNDDGPCTTANAGTVCRSGICDPDLRCGYANNNGPCDNINAGTICRSGVCDTDAKCGYANSSGSCDTLTAGTVCRSRVCDPDMKCGYAVANGPCSAADAGTVCRSTVCSVNNKCMPLGGCNRDLDCSSASFCMEGAHACTTKLTNGTMMPTDPVHFEATLNATCTGPAAAIACQSGTCDSDNRCGYLNSTGPCSDANVTVVCRSETCDPDGKCGYNVGEGPCNRANQGIVCRSGSCSFSNLCQPAGGCLVDRDCGDGNYCIESTKTCTPKLVNGTAMPSDPGHLEATLDGICNGPAAAIVCVSGVCDADNKCGYQNNTQTCTVGNAATVCRSSVCDPKDFKCGYTNNQGACTVADAATVCRSGVCDPDKKCGYANNNGLCMAGNATTVCRSQVCDSDNRCGYANSNGPCDSTNEGVVCRSGICDPDKKCGYANNNGPCDNANAGLICRSGVCDPDLKCGYANNVGPCDDANAGTICRSGVCDPDKKCGYANSIGPCTDADAAKVCRSSVCDPDKKCGYTNNVGPCTDADAPTVCRSGVCDPDKKCGYAVNSGPCSNLDAGTVCRSSSCSKNMLCQPPGGCNIDLDCATGNWCNETAHSCGAQLANGVAMPTDAAHVETPLDGTCTAAAATIVCQSGVCDTRDNKCGLLNGSGDCSTGNAATVCRSKVCDPDLKCGYADSSGPCDATNGAEVCRSMACSINLLCMPAGGCNRDGDCSTGNWCNETLHGCTPQLANGSAMPTDAAHFETTLNATCLAPAAAVVCASGVCDQNDNKCGLLNNTGPCTTANAAVVCRSSVCDPDKKCGYADGDGPCTMSNAGEVCRSAACSIAGSCSPLGGCLVDADCTGGNWCNQSQRACTPKLANGTPIPNDPPHTNPTLAAVCTPEASALVCQSSVCDTTDNQCGFANGNGSCTKDTSDVVCRSGYCDSLGACRPTGWCSNNLDCTDPNAPACDLNTHACLTVKLSGGGFCNFSTSREGRGQTMLVLLALAGLLLTFRTRSAPGRRGRAHT